MSSDGEQKDFVGEPRRWHMLAILCGQQLIDTMMWITFAPIALETSDMYGVSVAWVNGLSLMVLALFLPGMFSCSYLTATRGVRQTLLIAAGLHLFAASLRWSSMGILSQGFRTMAFAVLFTGQALSAFAQPICTNLSVRLAGDWFPVEERDQATTLGNVGFGLGNIAGMGVPGLIVKWVPGTHKVQGMGTLLFLELAMSLGGFVWTWSCFADEPVEAPSPAARLQRNLRKQHAAEANFKGTSAYSQLMGDYASLLRNRNFILLLIAFSTGLGFFNSLFTVLEQLFHTAGYDARATGFIGNVFIIGGTFTGAAVAKLLDQTHAYNVTYKCLFVATALTTLNLFLQIRPNQFGVLTASAMLMGAACLPLLPVSLEVAAEVSFPLAEESSTGLLIFAGNWVGVLLAVAYGVLIPMAPHFKTVWTPAAMLTLGGMAIATVAALGYAGESKRHAADISDPLLEDHPSQERRRTRAQSNLFI